MVVRRSAVRARVRPTSASGEISGPVVATSCSRTVAPCQRRRRRAPARARRGGV